MTRCHKKMAKKLLHKYGVEGYASYETFTTKSISQIANTNL